MAGHGVCGSEFLARRRLAIGRRIDAFWRIRVGRRKRVAVEDDEMADHFRMIDCDTRHRERAARVADEDRATDADCLNETERVIA